MEPKLTSKDKFFKRGEVAHRASGRHEPTRRGLAHVGDDANDASRDGPDDDERDDGDGADACFRRASMQVRKANDDAHATTRARECILF